MGHLAIPPRPLRRIGGCQALCLGFGRAHLPASSFSRNKLVPNPLRRLSLSRPPLPSLPLLIVISSCRWEEESDINGKKTEHSKSICGRHRPYLRLRCAPLAFFTVPESNLFFAGGKAFVFQCRTPRSKKARRSPPTSPHCHSLSGRPSSPALPPPSGSGVYTIDVKEAGARIRCCISKPK